MTKKCDKPTDTGVCGNSTLTPKSRFLQWFFGFAIEKCPSYRKVKGFHVLWGMPKDCEYAPICENHYCGQAAGETVELR